MGTKSHHARMQRQHHCGSSANSSSNSRDSSSTRLVNKKRGYIDFLMMSTSRASFFTVWERFSRASFCAASAYQNSAPREEHVGERLTSEQVRRERAEVQGAILCRGVQEVVGIVTERGREAAAAGDAAPQGSEGVFDIAEVRTEEQQRVVAAKVRQLVKRHVAGDALAPSHLQAWMWPASTIRTTVLVCHPTYGLPLAKLIARDAPRAVHDLAELVTTYAGNDLHGELQARLNQLGFRYAELDDDRYVQEGADYLKILDICETVRHLPDGNSDASKRRLLAQLQQLYVETDRTDYQDLMSGLFEQFPDDAAARRENRDAVWGLLPVPPKLTAPLPRFKPQPAFIRIDRTGMGELFPGLAARMAGRGPWWYAEFMQPWAKAANITTMRQRTNHYARSERGVMRAIERAGQPGYRILSPWLVDRTFMTDGHQLELLLVTSHVSHQGPHGLTELPRRGYQVGFINEELGDVLEGEVAEGPNGVFRLQRVHREIGAEPATVADGTPAAQERLHALDHNVVTGVDPGQVLAFSAVTALGQRWRRENAADFAANPPPEGEGATAQEVSGADYRVWAQSVRNEQGEAQRRGANQAYSDALAALADWHTRAGRYQVLHAYCTTWGHHADAMWGELLHPARRHQRFSRFRAQQAAVAKMAEKLAPFRRQHRPPGWKRVRSRGCEYPHRKRRHRRWRDTHRRPRRIILFGASGMPVSDIEDATAIQSASCLVCGQPTRGGGDEFGHRNRVCRNEDCALAQAAEGRIAVIDRDTHARANVGMRGVYATCGVADIIPGYVLADQEEEEDTEEEESDEKDDDEEDNNEEDGDDEDGEEGGDGDEGGDGGGGPVDDGEGGGDEEGVDEEGDAIMA
ncbi:hypothetical protein JKP88DRAFT_301038 [Tribonema minus]|uniref:Uncharacterized protein n=1 Tax=Tribonema minus TaxID=303371 RepID=A0A835ZFR8_9STRA|nr:hypothetical protein JKP88DRAFT_301038 [Tribonema minus]